MLNFPFKIGELLDVEIEKLSFGGNGIARKNDVVIFVPYSAPGDKLQVKITEIKKRHAIAEIAQILIPSGHRVPPLCPVYGKCGGCNLQHLSYSEQLAQKEALVREFLKKVVPTEFEFLPIVPSPQIFHYRNRVQLKFAHGKLGFFARGTHEIIPISDCPLIEKTLAEALPAAKEKALSSGAVEIPKIELSLLKNNDVQISLDESPLSGDGFSQVNRFQNELLTKTLLEWLKDKKFSIFFDLYAGAGNFSFPIMDAFQKIRLTAVELHPGAVKLAREKIKAFGLSPKKCEFYQADVALFLKRFPIPEGSIILLDPPRAGCSELVIEYLKNTKPQALFYISCDPAALSRDLDRLLQKTRKKWRLVRAQAFDMFPQTHHVETLVELTVDS